MRRPFDPPPVPPAFRNALAVWQLLGGLDWNGLDWAMQYVGITDRDQLILDLITIRDNHG